MTPEDTSALVTRVVTGAWLAPALYAMLELDVPERLRERPRYVDDLAAEVGARSEPLARTLRALVGQGIFAEGPVGYFGLNAAAQHLTREATGPLRAVVTVTTRDVLPLTAEFAHTLCTGRPAAEKVHGAPHPDHLQAHPEDGRTHAAVLVATTPPLFTAARAAGALGGIGTLVDLGGGDGAFLELALRADRGLRATLLERPDRVAAARERLTSVGVADRCSFRTGDFFQDVPTGGDRYLLARCLYQWDDAAARTLLRTVRAAMPPRGRLVLLEPVAGPDSPASRGADVVTLLLGGRQRTAEEHRALLTGAGLEPRTFHRVNTPTFPHNVHLVIAAPV